MRVQSAGEEERKFRTTIREAFSALSVSAGGAGARQAILHALLSQILQARGCPFNFQPSNFNFQPSTLRDIDFAAPDAGDLLGAAYEAVLPDRHGRGAYYTPGGEVALMCREALRTYLEERCSAPPEQVGALLDGKPSEVTPAAAAALRDIRVCDPAVGCGAFVVGMARLLIRCLQAVRPWRPELFRPGFDPRRHVVEQSLYGCEPDADALNVARQRLRLELGPAGLTDLRLNLVEGEALAGGLIPGANGRSADWERRFPGVFAGGGFDVVIGNPPYLRHQLIDETLRDTGAGFTKAALAEAYRTATGQRISPYADLYVYFFFRGLHLLKKESGVLCYVTSGAWLDSQYGETVRRFIADSCEVRAVMERSDGRSFGDAGVHTVVSLLITRERKTAAQPASFVTLGGECAGVSRRTRQVPQEQLCRSPGGGQWGAEFLRAPDLLFRVREQERVVSLGSLARVETYLNTGGADDFFFLRIVRREPGRVLVRPGGADVEFRIEARFALPLLESPSEAAPVLEGRFAARTHLLAIPRGTALEGGLLEYVRWGESRGFHRRSGTRARNPWYVLTPQGYSGAEVLWPVRTGQRHVVCYNPKRVVSHRFYRLHFREHAKAAAAFLNSTFAAMCAEIYTPSALGLGVLDVTGVMLSRLPVLDVSLLRPRERATLEESLDRLAGEPAASILEQCGYDPATGGLAPESAISPARLALDLCAGDLLGLSGPEQAEVRRTACSLADRRYRRAKPLSGR